MLKFSKARSHILGGQACEITVADPKRPEKFRSAKHESRSVIFEKEGRREGTKRQYKINTVKGGAVFSRINRSFSHLIS